MQKNRVEIWRLQANISYKLKKLSEKVWQFGENAYLCTRKTEINAVEPE